MGNFRKWRSFSTLLKCASQEVTWVPENLRPLYLLFQLRLPVCDVNIKLEATVPEVGFSGKALLLKAKLSRELVFVNVHSTLVLAELSLKLALAKPKLKLELALLLGQLLALRLRASGGLAL